ncbi:MAG TPA: ABC transporter ATP-binding protein [Dongiaceae bacterium]|jgi:multiple sugar transport system ATP-binding protein|nr:ABC transporter ATP-binding protein [Dongiaceae bacterium]
MTSLELRNVSKGFKSGKVLEDVSLSVNAGEIVVVFGPSGTGKTVLLRIVAGVQDPDTGSVAIDGEDVTDASPEARNVGMAFQNFALFPHFSTFDNIASPLAARETPAAKLKDQVGAIARMLKIDHVLGHAPRELSNGQKQRTALARALVAQPKVLLLDDPLRNVDAKLRYEMRLELPRLLRTFNAAVIYVTQDYKEAMALGDHIAVLRNGRIEQWAAPTTVYREPVSVEVARLFGDPTINLLPCKLEGDHVTLFGRLVPISGAYAHAAGRDLIAGLRPEHVVVTEAEAPGAIAFELDAVMPVNVRSVLYLRGAGGEELLATVGESEAAKFGRGHRKVWVRFDPRDLLLFDATSGQRIAPQVH